MMPSEAKSLKSQQLLEAKNCANTAAATGGWIDVRGMVGDLVVTQSVGAVTGSITGALLTSNASNGANNTAMTFDDGNNFAAVSSANNVQCKSVDANASYGWIQYVGTIATGPAVVSVTVQARPKVTS
jgi:hypothetical protein